MSLNKVMLIGNVGREPEIKYVDTNLAVARFSLATSERAYTLKNGTQVPERTEWHRIVAWRETAQFIEKYVHSGDKLYVEGQLRTRTYTDKNGIERSITEVMTEKVERLSGKATLQQLLQQSRVWQSQRRAVCRLVYTIIIGI